MANHKSSEKRARQSPRRAARNSQHANAVRTFEKKLRSALASSDKKGAETLLKELTSKVGKAAQKGVIHSRTAARKVSRLATRVQKLSAN